MSEYKAKKRGRTVRRVILWVLLAAVLFGAGSLGLALLRAKYTTVYQGYTARQRDLTDELSFDSTIRLVDSQTATASAAGKVRRVVKDEGDTVRKDDVILILESGERVRAGFDGRVNTVGYRAGEEFPQGATLCTVADFDHVQIQFNANEYSINDLTVGRECTVKITATGETFPASLSSINHVGNTGRNIAYYTCIIYLDVGSTVHPGMQVTVTFAETLAKDAVVVSRDGISFDDSNLPFVYLQGDDGRMVKTSVTIGAYNDDDAQILTGLAAGDVFYAVEEDETAQSLFAQMLQMRQQSTGTGSNTRRNTSGGSWGGNGGGMPGGMR